MGEPTFSLMADGTVDFLCSGYGRILSYGYGLSYGPLLMVYLALEIAILFSSERRTSKAKIKVKNYLC